MGGVYCCVDGTYTCVCEKEIKTLGTKSSLGGVDFNIKL